MTTRTLLRFLVLFAAALGFAAALTAQPTAGYYRFPAIHGDTVVFTAEGDLWKASVTGGTAQRLTTHAGFEMLPSISPDGRWVAFTAQYEGPQEIYLMPLTGGLPKRLTFEGENALVRGWTPDGKILYATRHYATLPDNQLVALDPQTGARTFVPLAQADEGAYDDAGKTLYFTRYSFQGSHAKRYTGGTAQNLWRLDAGAKDAVQFHPDFKGVSRWPMWSAGRVFFVSERDGTSNLWSMKPDGSDLRQHTKHADFGVKSPQHHGGRIVYQNGADLWLYDTKSDRSTRLELTLASDFDQTRETWVTKVTDFITATALSPDGDRMAFVARGQVFVAPASGGRLVEVTRQSGVRYRSVAFTPDGKSLIVLSDQSGEVEFWKVPTNGIGTAEQLTTGADNLRMSGFLSPDGKLIAYSERDEDLMLFNLETKETKLIAHSRNQDFRGADVDWAPDSKWLAYVLTPATGNSQIQLYSVESGQSTPATSDRVISNSPAFSPDGKWLYFLSDRTFNSPVLAPWGPRQPEPFLDKPTKVYLLALADEKRSPFQATDELSAEEKKAADKKDEKKSDDKADPAKDDKKPEPTGKADDKAVAKSDEKKSTDTDKKADAAKKPEDKKPKVEVKVALEGLMDRLWEVPVASGNYGNLTVSDKAVFFTDRDAGATGPSTARLLAVEIKNKDVEIVTVASGVASYRLSLDTKKMLLQQGENYAIIDAGARPAGDVSKSRVSLGGVRFAYSPRESWRQMFTDAWRLHRDYFYAKNMHGVDWKANLDKHLPLVDRVTDRSELNDLLNYLVSELSALHTDANGGEFRDVEPVINVASLGARWSRDEKAGGYRLDYIFQSDPEFLERRGPLLKPGTGIKVGDVITAINGVATLSVPDAAALLRHQANKQVLLTLTPAAGGESFSRVVTPVPAAENANLRYTDWEYTRRLTVDEKSKGEIGYAHIRAMGTANFYEFVRNYYSAANKAGLVLDLRHNRGGNMDSWMVSRLMRPAWMWWSTRDGDAFPHLQNPFRGHLVVLVDAWTASDGETMANAVRKLNLGKTLGTRTWGGGIWLTGSNFLVDRGIARAAEFGSFIPGEGWVIEGDGFTPDIIVDNNPARAFTGEDAQLDAAIKHLQELIKKDPRHVLPTPPPWPDKSQKSAPKK
ncbi:MAG: protease [Opitutus sp.]|nr:protease [Opitutus sp.]